MEDLQKIESDKTFEKSKKQSASKISGSPNKKNKGRFYKKADLILYGLLAIIIVTLLFIFVIFPKTSTYRGFNVYIGNTLILSYEYQKDFTITNGYSEKIEIDKTNNKIKIYTDGEKKEYNILQYSDAKKQVKVIDANCESKDCTKMQDSIYCSPHKLKVVPMGKVSPTVG